MADDLRLVRGSLTSIFEGFLESLPHGGPRRETEFLLRLRHVRTGMADVAGPLRLADGPDRSAHDLGKVPDHVVHGDRLAAAQGQCGSVDRFDAREFEPARDAR